MGTPTKRKLGVHTYFVEEDDDGVVIVSPPIKKKSAGICSDESEDNLNVSDADPAAVGVIVEDQPISVESVPDKENLKMAGADDTPVECHAETHDLNGNPMTETVLDTSVDCLLETHPITETVLENPSTETVLENPSTETVLENPSTETVHENPSTEADPKSTLINIETTRDNPMTETVCGNPSNSSLINMSQCDVSSDNPMTDETVRENPICESTIIIETTSHNPTDTILENPCETAINDNIETSVDNSAHIDAIKIPNETLIETIEKPIVSPVENPLETLQPKNPPKNRPPKSPRRKSPRRKSPLRKSSLPKSPLPKSPLSAETNGKSNTERSKSTDFIDLEEGEITDGSGHVGSLNTDTVDARHPPCSSVGDRLRYIFLTHEFWDCSVTAGDCEKQKTFRCHKVVLAMTSSKFRTLLMDSNHIFTDLKPEHFEILLQYMYLDKFTLSSVEEACAIYKAALQYDVPHLLKLTRDYMLKNLNADNILSAFDLAVECDDRQLKTGCSLALADNPSAWGTLKSVKKSLLIYLLDLKTINVQEILVLRAVDEWATHQCTDQLNIDANHANKRQIIGPEILSKIRFLAITPQDFVSYCVLGNSFLTTEEMFAIHCCLTVPKVINLPDWMCGLNTSRGTTKPQRVIRRKNFTFSRSNSFTDAYALCGPTPNHPVGAKQFSTCFAVSKAIVLQGIQVPSLWYPPFHQSHNNTSYEEVYNIEITDLHYHTLTRATVVLDVQFASVVDIMFKEGVTLDSFVDYNINVSTSKTYFLTKEFRSAENHEKVKFSFKDTVIPENTAILQRNEHVPDLNCGFVIQLIFSLFL